MRGFIALLAMFTAAATAAGQQSTAAADRFVGTWQGTLGQPGSELQLGLAVARDASGELQAVLTSVDQPGLTIPTSVSMHADTLIVDIPMIHGSYAAVASGDSLRGEFLQSGKALTFKMGRLGAHIAAEHSQEPQPPFPYRAQDIVFQSKPGVRLAGTLTLPEGRGPFPAVVLVPGSGAEDRDESFAEHKPFLVIADYLARHGIASLRYDDRGVGTSTGAYAGATSADLADDAEAAVHFLQTNPSVARTRVGIVGHSEGGIIGPMVAARSKDVAFLVLLAAPGLPGDSLAMLQKEAVFANNDMSAAEIAQGTHFARQVYDEAKSSADSASATAKIQALARQYIASLPPAERADAEKDGLAESASAVTSPWSRYVLRYDPRPALRHIQVPVLALDGTLDIEVSARENLPAIDSALKAAGNHDYRIVVMPNLNHSLQTAVTGNPAEAVRLTETVAPSVLELMTSWINERFGHP